MLRALQASGWPAWTVLAIALVTVAVAVAHAVRPTRRTLTAAVVAVAITFLAGPLGTVVGLSGAFGAVASADPSQKATRLARGISGAMHATAIALGATLLWSIPFVVGEVRRRRSPGRALRPPPADRPPPQ